jgi:hypothetical protein
MSRPVLHRVALPDRENEIVFHPSFSQWPALLRDNGRMKSETPDGDRSELLQSASDYTREILGVQPFPDVSRQVVATGHQCIWHHCGIWAKNVATCRLAEAVGGTAMHLVLDHDVRSSSLMLPPSGSDGCSGVREIEIERGPSPVPIESRSAPERARIEAFVTAACAAAENPVCGRVWPEWVRRLDARPRAFAHLADFITYMQGALYLSLGLNLLYLPVSRLSGSTAFLAFAAGLLCEARRFAVSYNEAIELLGQADVRPLRVRDTDRTELPFWLVLPGGWRESLWVGPRKGDRIHIGTDGQDVDSLDASCGSDVSAQLKVLLVRHQCHLRPKAITLTLFARMVLADWFVHGVGAQGYEAVTDYLIEQWFGKQVPHFGVATCTMRLPMAGIREPLAADGASTLKHRLHHMEHNPEKYLSREQLREDWISRLVEEKSSLLSRLCSDAEDAGHKKAAHAKLREINERLFHCLADGPVRPLQHADPRGPVRTSSGVFDSREFFFGLFAGERLKTVADAAGAVAEDVRPNRPPSGDERLSTSSDSGIVDETKTPAL